MKIRIALWGCDNYTIVTRNVNKSQLAFLHALAADTHALGGGCNPTMDVVCPKDFKRVHKDGSSSTAHCDKPFGHTDECGWRD